MADNKKIYSIQINGIDQSIKQVDALSDALQFLDKKIKELESRSVSITSSNSGGSSRNADLQTEDKLLKQIQSTEQQIRDARREDYASLLAQKDLLKDITDEAKQRAAAERLSVGNYGNTIKGLKQELSDIKTVMQTTDLGSNKFDELNKRASELVNKLKELGQFGKNTGNYKSVFDEAKKITVQVGNTTREFKSVRDASRQLEQEFKALVHAEKEGTKEFEELSEAIHKFAMAEKRAESAVNDLKASSQGMDDILDMFESFTALGSISQGFSAFFGIDDTEIQRSIQKLVALQNVMEGIEKIRQQMNTQEGIGKIFQGGNEAIDSFVSNLTGAQIGVNGLTKGSKVATLAVRGLSLALKGLAIGVVIGLINMLVQGFERLTKIMNSNKATVDALNSSMNALNKEYDKRTNSAQLSLMRGEISNNEYLARLYKEQNDYIQESINLLNQRAKLANNRSWYDVFDVGGSNTGYTGQKLTGSTTIGAGHLWSFTDIFGNEDFDFSYTINSIEEAREAWEKLNAAVVEGKDYFSKYGEGLLDYMQGMLTTVEETREVMHGTGNVILSDYIGNLKEAYNEFAKAQNDVYRGVDGSREKLEKAKAKVLELSAAMNDDKILRTIIANLQDYIPEEEIREQLNRIIGFFDDFSAKIGQQLVEQEHFWNNKRIAAMKDGNSKINAQIDEDMRYEIVKYGDSEEHINLIKAEANRKRLEQQEKYNEQAKNKAKQHAKEIEAAEKELQSLRIQNMAEGLSKQLAQLKEERRQKIANAKENGIKVGEITAEINKLYDKKIEDARKQHAKEVEKIYTNMWRDIFNINYENSEKEFEIQKSRLEYEYEELKEIAARNSGTANQSLSDRDTIITKKPKSKEGSTDPNDFKYDVLIEKEAFYTQRLMEEFKKRTQDRENYYAEIQRLSIEEENKRYELETANAKTNYENEKRLLDQSYQDRELQYKDYLQRGVITQAQYNEISKNLEIAKESQLNTIQKTYQTNSDKMLKEHNQKMADAQNQSNEAFVQNVEELLSQLSNVDFSQLSKNQSGLILNDINNLVNQISSRIAELESELKRKDLTKPQREQIEKLIQQLKGLKTQAGQTASDIEKSTNEKLEKLIANINSYVQALGQSLQSILDAVWSVQDAAYEQELENLDKTLEATKEKYNEMDALAEEHKSNMESLEDKIKDAQGSARDALIERYNAEKLAQREALAEKKKIEKEEEKLQAKKDKMELEQKKREKKRNLVTAAINTAMAISMAAVNPWPHVAIPMMAAAAAAGAAQIAAIAAQNYAHGGQLDGGVAQGNRHRDGGIKVLGGHAEIEGGEFVTNRLTTSKNIDLLEYINSKKKRININDLIEFYGGDSPVKKNIQNVRTRFAEGGVIPTLATVDTSDRLLTVIEDYSNRPVQVAVVDIIDRTQQVNDVRVMAGLDV